jgi:hypothetical protein
MVGRRRPGAVVGWAPRRHPDDQPWTGRVLQGPVGYVPPAVGGGRPPLLVGAGRGALRPTTAPPDGLVYPVSWLVPPTYWGCVQPGSGATGLRVTQTRSYSVRADLTFTSWPPAGLVRLEAIAIDGITVRTLLEQPPQPQLTLMLVANLAANEQVRVALTVGMVPSADMVMSAGTFSVLAP